ncbi:MAG: hypothetical protein U5L45_02350 [Saprospiraceae bacterium]|nr:hypothetical protein [Saprospiraceae bacterium]
MNKQKENRARFARAKKKRWFIFRRSRKMNYTPVAMYKYNAVLNALFLASLENCAKEIYRGERVFEREKSKIFLFQKYARPK